MSTVRTLISVLSILFGGASLTLGPKVARSGLLGESIFLFYSQERPAAYGIQPARPDDILRARNISTPGGQVNVEGKNVTIEPFGEFKSGDEIGDVLVPTMDA